jgi:hypothetical protein
MECCKPPPKMPSKTGVSRAEIAAHAGFKAIQAQHGIRPGITCRGRNGHRPASGRLLLDQSDGIEACEKRLYLVVIKRPFRNPLSGVLLPPEHIPDPIVFSQCIEQRRLPRPDIFIGTCYWNSGSAGGLCHGKRASSEAMPRRGSSLRTGF